MLRTDHFDYDLPPERIADRPNERRDGSRLLVYRQGAIEHRMFTDLPQELPSGSMLVFNNTRVLPARLLFHSPTGAQIEIFLLEPETDHQTALLSTGTCVWKSLIGNRKRWKTGTRLERTAGPLTLQAEAVDDTVRLTWSPAAIMFSEVMEIMGIVPLPPYLKRDANDEDRERYQTVYAQHAGAVAAPTAGLHFTPEILNRLTETGFHTSYLTLHVGAGTFLPVKTENAEEHRMHEEHFIVTREELRRLAKHDGPVVPVGTTSMRTLETLYWMGVRLHLDPRGDLSAPINQDFAYRNHESVLTFQAAMDLLSAYLDMTGLDRLHSSTSIFIRPGYRMRACRALITNFHQPRSTLLMLICALVGGDWRRIYQEALVGDYRFLSYGDSSLLIP